MCGGLVEVVLAVGLILLHVVALGQWNMTHCAPAPAESTPHERSGHKEKLNVMPLETSDTLSL